MGLAAVLAGIWAIFAAALVAKGGLYLGKHEGDTMHLAEIVLRQAAGGWPHLDFMTPIGLMATAPIALFVEQGMGLGRAFLAAQALVAAALLPAIWWVGASRMRPAWAILFGVIVIVLASALVHGEAQRSLSVSMHYNRWAWALSFLAIAIAVLPPRYRTSSAADGVVLGAVFAMLALIKVTYLVAFLPVVLLSLAIRRDVTAVVWALGVGLLVAAAVTLAAGPAFWGAYVGDLLAVAGSDIRSAPGLDLGAVVAAPAYLGGSLVGVAAVILLRQSGRQTEGLLLLTLLPGFFYVTYQNYGNDPQWLYLLGVLLLALRPAAGTVNGLGWDMRQALALTGCAAFMLGLPSAMNLASSPFRHLATDTADYTPLFPRSERHDDIRMTESRSLGVAGVVRLAGFPLPEGHEDAVLNGETLRDCQLTGGTVQMLDATAQELEALGHAGKAILSADLFSSIWLFGPFRPLEGGAPWYYGGLPGVEDADLLLVPQCPVLKRARLAVLEAVVARGWEMSEVARTDGFVLVSIQRD